MKKSEKMFRELKENRLVALLTPGSADEGLRAYELLLPLGVVLEITFRSEFAAPGLEQVLGKHPGALVLAGTVMTVAQAERALKAGAAGIVSADYIPEVVDFCADNDLLCIPGGLADAGKQLVRKAATYGCSMEELREKHPYQWIYKLFPAIAGAVSNAELAVAWRGPYKDLTVVYAGGVTLETLPRLAALDATGIFCASAPAKNLDKPDLLKAEVEKWKAALSPATGVSARTAVPKAAPGETAQVPRVVTFGELMLRLAPPVGVRLAQARGFDLHFGGAEANVAVSLARFGLDAAFVTALPANELGDNACDTLRGLGVDVSRIIRKGGRMGLYYLEHGAGPRPSKVVYDRAHSAASEITPGDFDWDRILEGAAWFHWTGITPALGDSVAAVLREAIETAKAKGVTVSADLNYRKTLWNEEKARSVLSGLLPYVDILFANEEDPKTVFGIEPQAVDLDKGKLSPTSYRAVAEELLNMFGCRRVAVTLRESISASENRWSACLFDGKDFLVGPVHHVRIVDRVGAGDAFAAGLIYGILTGKDDTAALNFAVSASCLKHSILGDFNLATVAEVERLAAGAVGGRIQR
jgi:2-dehydro-3-deoxygluconokinase